MKNNNVIFKIILHYLDYLFKMTSLNDLLEAAKAVEDDKGKKIVQKTP